MSNEPGIADPHPGYFCTVPEYALEKQRFLIDTEQFWWYISFGNVCGSRQERSLKV